MKTKKYPRGGSDAPAKLKKGKARTRVRPPRHAHLHGAGVFDAAFFKETLPSLVNACPCPDGTKPVVTVWLADGSRLDCCGVVGLAERYCVLAAYDGAGDDGVERTADDVGVEAIPYELVLRCSVRAASRPHRLGFGEGFVTEAPE